MNHKNTKNEAEQTVRKRDGKYYNLAEDILTKQGRITLSRDEFMDLFKKVRLRFTLTPLCNIFCNFCSNEGSNYTAKKLNHSNIDLITHLSDILIKNTPLNMIDISGGEPTIHPDFINREYKLIEWTKGHPNIRFSLHSNGIGLIPEIIDEIYENFSRIGFSINSLNFNTWNKITNFRGMFNEKNQRKKFNQMMENLDYL